MNVAPVESGEIAKLTRQSVLSPAVSLLPSLSANPAAAGAGPSPRQKRFGRFGIFPQRNIGTPATGSSVACFPSRLAGASARQGWCICQ